MTMNPAQDAARVRIGEQAQTESRYALQQRLANLENLDAVRLRQEWRRLFRSDPPQVSRDLVLRALAYRLQERERGGLSKAILRRLAAEARELRAVGPERPAPRSRLRPAGRGAGSRMARTQP